MIAEEPRSASPTRQALVLLALLFLPSCTREAVTGVTVEAVTVLPPSITVLENETAQLLAEVRGENGRLLEAAEVAWFSDRPSVLTVSPSGLVSARSAGSATVTASFGEVHGTASVTVTSLTLLRVEPESVRMHGAVGSGPPPPVELDILNEGSESVTDLEASVAYPAGAEAGWIEAHLEGRVSPTRLQLSAHTEGLPAGAFEASILVWSRDTRDAPVVVPVSLTLAGIEVTETDGRTLVSGPEERDHIEVVLLLRPDHEVVLTVRSVDPSVATVSPETLRFTPDNWDAPQRITVAAGSRSSSWFWGVDETEVTIAVDLPRSDSLYSVVHAVRVPVTVLRRLF